MRSFSEWLRQKSDWLLVYAVYFFVVAVVSYVPVWFFGSDEIPFLHDLPGLCMIPMFWFSLKKIYADYDEILYGEYLDCAPEGPVETLSFLLRRPVLYFDLAGLALCYLVLPFSIGFRTISHRFLPDLAGFYKKLLLFLPLFAMYLLLAAAAQAAAIRMWKRREKTTGSVFSACSTEQFYRQRDQKTADTTAMYLLKGSVTAIFITLIVQVLLLFWKELVKPPVFLLILALIGSYAAFLFGRAFAVRVRFYRNLKDCCEKEGYHLKSVRRPLRSLFWKGKGPSFLLEKEGKTYACKLLAGVRRRIPLLIFPTGYAIYFKVFYFRGGGEIFTSLRTVKFSFDAPGEKILIVNPSPKLLYTGTNARRVSIDNGARVGDYTIYTGGAFLNAMRRTVLDR